VVMPGKAPDTPAFAELFDWPDAVVPVKPDGSDIAPCSPSLIRSPSKCVRSVDETPPSPCFGTIGCIDGSASWTYPVSSRGMAARMDRLEELASRGRADADRREALPHALLGVRQE
jgi:hypothetical protein